MVKGKYQGTGQGKFLPIHHITPEKHPSIIVVITTDILNILFILESTRLLMNCKNIPIHFQQKGSTGTKIPIRVFNPQYPVSNKFAKAPRCNKKNSPDFPDPVKFSIAVFRKKTGNKSKQ